MKRIYKYKLPLTDQIRIDLPLLTAFRHLEMQGDSLCMWAEVDPESPPKERTFYIVGTGHVVPSESTFLGTALCPPFVWHLYQQWQTGLGIRELM